MIKDGDLHAYDDKVIVKVDKATKTTNSGIITLQEEKEMNRGEITHSAIEGLTPGLMLYYKYGRTIRCEAENKDIEYVVVEKENIWCIDTTY